MILTALQIYELARAAAFPDDVFVSPGVSVAEAMVAIALRESGGDPNAFNGNAATGDRSYGLWQINCKELGPRALTFFEISDEARLFEPPVNAHAAFVLYGGSLKNLDVAWYIYRPGIYKSRYEAHLAAAKAAALAAA